MSASSTSVCTSEDQTTTDQPADAQTRLQKCIATAEALDSQLEAASRRERSRVPVHPAFNSDAVEADPERHTRKCKICHHRDRDLIEADFLEWSHPSQICEDYKVSYRALYRHAVATGLLERRRENVSIVVHKLLEEVEYVENPSAFAILRAVRTLASLDSRGRWNEPPTTHVVVNTTEEPVAAGLPRHRSSSVELAGAPSGVHSGSFAGASVAEGGAVNESASDYSAPLTGQATRTTDHDQYSNRHSYEKLELDATHTKQSSEAISNRHKT
jgi:hypothetical protein